MSKTRERNRGPSIGVISKTLGYDDHKVITRPLREFWLSKFMNVTAFLNCSDDDLNNVAQEFLRKHGRRYWGGQKGRYPVYPDDEPRIMKDITLILKRQKRNKSDTQRRKPLRSQSPDEEEEDMEFDDASNYEPSHEQSTTSREASHVEPPRTTGYRDTSNQQIPGADSQQMQTNNSEIHPDLRGTTAVSGAEAPMDPTGTHNKSETPAGPANNEAPVNQTATGHGQRASTTEGKEHGAGGVPGQTESLPAGSDSGNQHLRGLSSQAHESASNTTSTSHTVPSHYSKLGIDSESAPPAEPQTKVNEKTFFTYDAFGVIYKDGLDKCPELLQMLLDDLEQEHNKAKTNFKAATTAQEKMTAQASLVLLKKVMHKFESKIQSVGSQVEFPSNP